MSDPSHHPPLIEGGATVGSSLAQEYRKGNWTIQETLILITAKKLDEERRLKTPLHTTRTSGELRWKWVENYCCNRGCLRSQNQCNDKWDNLLRDYKKVRDYHSKTQQHPSYWSLNKQQRKDLNLPSNMLFELYQAITQVLQTKHQHQQPPPPITLLTSSPLPPPPPPPPPPVSSTTPTGSERLESSKGEHSEGNYGSESKRRKVKNLGSIITQSASVLARALRSCEEKKDKRHRKMIEMEQRRLQMEEARNEVHRQGIDTLVAVVTNLSSAIQSLISSDARHGQA